MSTIGTTNTPIVVKIREVTLQFLGDLTWNDSDALLDHFRQNLLFSNVHHGFVPRRPCVRQLLTVMSSILALKPLTLSHMNR